MELKIAAWANADDQGNLIVESGERPIKMMHSDGTGSPLFTSKGFGADIIRFPPNGKVGNHTHEGDHILFVIRGTGIVEYDGVQHELYPGLAYLVPGQVPHAIYAKEELILIAVGNDHRPLNSEDRLNVIS